MKTPWDKIFKIVPQWLLDFDAAPDAAIAAALDGSYYFDSLNVAEPPDLLIDWARGLGARFDFISRFDAALARWIYKNWGRAANTRRNKSYLQAAKTWLWLSQIVANVKGLQQAPAALRKYFNQRQTFLGPLSAGTAHDPLGMYLYALARHQRDGALAVVWWDHCNLKEGILWHHGRYGLVGLRNLPPASENERGAFPEHLPKGLALLGQALYRQSRKNKISLEQAEAEFKHLANYYLPAYPFAEIWRAGWKKEIASGTVDETVVNWMKHFFPDLAVSTVLSPDRSNMIADLIAQMAEWGQRSVIEVIGVSGIGKTTFQKNFLQTCRTQPQIFGVYLDLGKTAANKLPNPKAVIAEMARQIGVENDLFKNLISAENLSLPAQELTSLLVKYLQMVLALKSQRHFAVLLFDSVEECSTALRGWLLSSLGKLSALERLMIVVAHDVPLNLAARPELGSRVYARRLREFDCDFMRLQLQSLGLPVMPPTDESWTNAIYGLTQGHPLATQIAAQVIQEQPKHTGQLAHYSKEILQRINRQIIQGKIFRNFRRPEAAKYQHLLMPLAVPRQFNIYGMNELLSHFAPKYRQPIDNYGYLINELYNERGLIWRDESLDAYKVVPPLRSVFTARLCEENRGRFNDINRFLVEFYERGRQNVEPGQQGVLILETTYHRLQLGVKNKQLLPEFEQFAAMLQQVQPAAARRACQRQFLKNFQQDADLGWRLDEPTKRRIQGFFHASFQTASKHFIMGGA